MVDPLDSYSKEVSLVEEILSLVFALSVFEIEGLGPGSELEALVLVRVVDQLLKELPDLGLAVSFPLLGNLFGPGQNLDLDEVLVGFEERKLLE